MLNEVSLKPGTSVMRENLALACLSVLMLFSTCYTKAMPNGKTEVKYFIQLYFVSFILCVYKANAKGFHRDWNLLSDGTHSHSELNSDHLQRRRYRKTSAHFIQTMNVSQLSFTLLKIDIISMITFSSNKHRL